MFLEFGESDKPYKWVHLETKEISHCDIQALCCARDTKTVRTLVSVSHTPFVLIWVLLFWIFGGKNSSLQCTCHLHFCRTTTWVVGIYSEIDLFNIATGSVPFWIILISGNDIVLIKTSDGIKEVVQATIKYLYCSFSQQFLISPHMKEPRKEIRDLFFHSMPLFWLWSSSTIDRSEVPFIINSN